LKKSQGQKISWHWALGLQLKEKNSKNVCRKSWQIVTRKVLSIVPKEIYPRQQFHILLQMKTLPWLHFFFFAIFGWEGNMAKYALF
jgi:hypothetical protein